MKICVKKLINVIFFTIASPSSVLAMQKDIPQEDEMFQSFKNIISEHELEYQRQKQEAVCINFFIEGIIADLLECKKKFPSVRSEIYKSMIADLLLKLASPQHLNLTTIWAECPSYISQYFFTPLENEVFDILIMVREANS